MGAKCPRDEYYFVHESALADAEDDPWIGQLAAEKYVIVARISEGGMGAVYRAIQLPVQREVAFKVLLAELQGSEQGKERFAREARAISRLSHPNVIAMHDFGVDAKGHPFMAMEYAPGVSLAEWMMVPGLSLERILHVFGQILGALTEAHQQGVIHRDLKPENLIVTRAGADLDFIKLLDFGIARMVHDSATRGLTRDGEVFGTPHYMSPEQARGQKNIGPPADVYSLGIMLYELLCGECPFDAPTPLSILYMHIHDELPPVRPKNRMKVPAGVLEVLEQATRKDPQERFQDAGEMLQAFNQALADDEGSLAGASGNAQRAAPLNHDGAPTASTDPAGLANGAGAARQDPLVASHTMPLIAGVGADGNEGGGEPGSDLSEQRAVAAAAAPIDPNLDTAVGMKRRNPLPLFIAGVAIVLLLVGGVLVFSRDNRDNKEAAPERGPTVRSESTDYKSADPLGDKPARTPVEQGAAVDKAAEQDHAGSEKPPGKTEPAAADPVEVQEGATTPAHADKPRPPEAPPETRPSKPSAKPAGVSSTAERSGSETTPAPKNAAKATGSSAEEDAEDKRPRSKAGESAPGAPQKFEPKKSAPAKSAPQKFQPQKWN